MKLIAVIGAGPTGLCAARHIASRSDMEVVVYEQTKSVGGTWNYTEEADKDENGVKIHSAVYKNLLTNLPKEVMAFPDYPFDEELPSYVSHYHVKSYLESYCEHFELRRFIQFETIVYHVKPVNTSSGKKWEIKLKKLKQKTTLTYFFDAVFVCNGHYSKPQIPCIPGREHFKGKMIHSHAYRHPEVFADQVVVVLGAGSSGSDISLDVAKHAKMVVISHRTPRLESPLPRNVLQRQTITRFDNDGTTIHFTDGSKIEADSLIFCTGYYYDYPFLHPSCDIEVEDSRVKYLYNHTICVTHPSLVIVGICRFIAPFPHFHYQILYALGVLDGSVKLPSRDEMVEEIETDYTDMLKKGLPHRAAHHVRTTQWDLNNLLADKANVPRLKKHYRDLFIICDEQRTNALCNYKKSNFRMLEDGSYEVSSSIP